MKCPRDRSVLAFSDEGRHACNKCPQCHGLLLDEHEVGAVLARGRGAAPQLAAERIATLPQAAVACPREGAAMRTLVHEGVELDLCPECRSLWLDAGELEKIRKRGRKGGGARAAAVAGAALAGAATVAAAEPARSSLAAGAAELAGEVAVEGVIEVAFELLAEGLGALLS